jgi:quercetin dioxygenase-like cupin family protein
MLKLPTIVVVKRTRRGVGVGQAQQLEALRRGRDGLVSRFLLHEGAVSDARMTVTWVDVAPGSGQRAHSHAPEQIYVVVKGWGTMWAGGEERLVVEGDVVFIPPNTVHGIENASDENLTHVSAATATVDWRAFYDEGPLRQRT